jgi:hypothetical protein
MSWATLLQITPAVNGADSEPRTLVIRPSPTVTLRLQVSGQSKVQTLARSMADMGGLLFICTLTQPRRLGSADCTAQC